MGKELIESQVNYDENDVVTLTNESGEELSFLKIALISLEAGVYAILRPLFEMPDLAEDEALAFEVHVDEDGKEDLAIVEDEDTVAAVFAEYGRLLEEESE